MKYLDAVALLKMYGIEFAEGSISRSVDEALRVAQYPVALKVLSDEILHKSDKGCVKLNIKDEDSLRKAYSELMANAGNARIDGIFVQKMAKPGHELIVGGRRDEQFGPVILFGLGGIFVEVFKDFSLRVCPIDKADAMEMISEIKGYPLLSGYRGEKPVDMEAIIELLLKTSRLLYDNEKVKEMDMNPVIVYEKGYCAVDVRVIN
jgi:acyl-CoA synthetase (NDP forming)